MNSVAGRREGRNWEVKKKEVSSFV